jgi:hypothetical protein
MSFWVFVVSLKYQVDDSLSFVSLFSMIFVGLNEVVHQL